MPSIGFSLSRLLKEHRLKRKTINIALNPGPDPAPDNDLSSVAFKMSNKIGFISSFLTDKKSQGSHKTVETQVFLIFLLYDVRIRIEIRILIPTNNGGSPSRTWKHKSTNPTDPHPDLQH
jgi:hypothetical protein